MNARFFHKSKSKTTRVNTWYLHLPRLLYSPDCFMVSILCMYLSTKTTSPSWLFHSRNPLHIYWSRQPRVFWCLTSLVQIICISLISNTNVCVPVIMTQYTKYTSQRAWLYTCMVSYMKHSRLLNFVSRLANRTIEWAIILKCSNFL